MENYTHRWNWHGQLLGQLPFLECQNFRHEVPLHQVSCLPRTLDIRKPSPFHKILQLTRLVFSLIHDSLCFFVVFIQCPLHIQLILSNFQWLRLGRTTPNSNRELSKWRAAYKWSKFKKFQWLRLGCTTPNSNRELSKWTKAYKTKKNNYQSSYSVFCFK